MFGKKSLALLLAVILSVGSMAIPALADDAAGEDLQTVLLEVKSRISIPEDYSEFTYSVNSDGKMGQTWRFQWSKKDSAELISAVADRGGNLISYQKTQKASSQLLEADFSAEEAQQTAQDFLYRVNTTAVDRFIPVSTLSQMDVFMVTFEEQVNGLPVRDSSASVTVSKENREVTMMNLSRAYGEESFPQAENVISAEEAQAAYLSEIGFHLTYRTYVDYEGKTAKGYPVFTAPGERQTAIDAVTGEAVDVSYRSDENYRDESIKGGGGSTANSSASADLSPEELAEITKAKDLMAQEQALETVNQLFGTKLQLASASLTQNYYDKERYTWNLNLTDGDNSYSYASLDAKSGLVTSFSCYKENPAESGTLTLEAAQDKAAQLLASNAGDIAALYQVNSELSEEMENGFSIFLNRYHDGIQVEDQTLSVMMDKDGRVASYRLVHYENTEFVSMEGSSVDPNTDQVFQAFDKYAAFGPCYIPVNKDGETRIVLAYDFTKNSLPSLDGKLLIPVDYRGEPVETQGDPQYTDLEGHWVKNIVDTLAYNDIYMVKEDAFQPDKVVTEGEFVDFLTGSTVGTPYPVGNLFRGGNKEEILADGDRNRPIDRQTAAKYVVRMLGYEELAAKPEIFQYLFSDPADEANKPYIMICYALDVMRGNEDGSFNPGGQLTRAETAVILYNVLKTNKYRL